MQVGRHALRIVKKHFPEVNQVIDAKTDINIEVTKHDDEVSRRKDHEGCAMAVACKRKLHLDGVIIARSIAYLIKGNKATRFLVPERAAREVISFDRGGGFDPGIYKLDKPAGNQRLGHVAGGQVHGHQRGENKGKLVSARKIHRTQNVRTILGKE